MEEAQFISFFGDKLLRRSFLSRQSTRKIPQWPQRGAALTCARLPLLGFSCAAGEDFIQQGKEPWHSISPSFPLT